FVAHGLEGRHRGGVVDSVDRLAFKAEQGCVDVLFRVVVGYDVVVDETWECAGEAFPTRLMAAGAVGAVQRSAVGQSCRGGGLVRGCFVVRCGFGSRSGRVFLSVRRSCGCKRGLLQVQHVGYERFTFAVRHDYAVFGGVLVRQGNHDVVRSGFVLDVEQPRVARHYRVRHDGARVVQVHVLPDVARLAAADVGEVGTGALRTQQGR